MTAQTPERLLYKRRKMAMFVQPLEVYFELIGHKPDFARTTTACWRGYVGNWKIERDRLYLTGINGWFEEGEEVTLDSIFPGQPDRVLADWFSGTIHCPRGRLVKYVHAGYGSLYEAKQLIYVNRGIVIGTELIQNTNNFEGGASSSC